MLRNRAMLGKAYKQAKETKETTERIEEKPDKILRLLVKENARTIFILVVTV